MVTPTSPSSAATLGPLLRAAPDTGPASRAFGGSRLWGAGSPTPFAVAGMPATARARHLAGSAPQPGAVNANRSSSFSFFALRQPTASGAREAASLPLRLDAPVARGDRGGVVHSNRHPVGARFPAAESGALPW
ncbi:hypothetical protein AB0K15_23695 [Amycolatopsis sp. NPDC049253]|uniref:hypothetical protein n=1 Tax=Amycolatopsis sp. NPDC049253 TaxID=3155274 RepID=UPI0034495831